MRGNMKVTIDKPELPAIISIALETQDEADRLYCLVNYPPLRAWFGRENAKMIRHALKPIAQTYLEIWRGFIDVVAPKPENIRRVSV